MPWWHTAGDERDIKSCAQNFTVSYLAQGTVNLVALARQRSLKKFVLVTSIGTDDFFNVLNLFFLVL